jgi:Tfp pilus assembly protein PilX
MFMKHPKRSAQNGIALFSALMVLLLLSALAVGLVMMSNTETTVETNYRQERMLDFAARAGIEEVRDRLVPSNAATLVSPTCTPAAACLAAAPVVPSAANQGILYVRGGATPASVTPWTAGTVYTDDELCHDGYGLVAVQSSDVRCTTVPAGAGWYASTTSNAPWAGTAAALPYQWVRVGWKLNGSVQNYPVDSASCPATGAAGCGTPVCWNGSQEVLLPAGDTACSQMAPQANPVYLMTSLAVSPTTGARKMVQAEAALPPSVPTQNAGFFATSSACGAFTMTGGATTDGFSSANGGYQKTKSNNAGGIGSNGNVGLSGNKTQVGGNIYTPNTTIGACPDGVSESGGAGMDPGNSVVAQSAQTIPTPPAPNPLPPTTGYTAPSTMVPGNYGNVSIKGAVSLAPGVYNINSITANAQADITISPAGAVVLNIAGQGTTQPLVFVGQAQIDNSSGVAANFQINYAGTQNLMIAGGTNAYAVINAPNAPIKFTGGSDFYGSATGSTIDDTGGTSLHFDTTLLSNTTPTATNYTEIGLREVAY